MGGLGEGPHVAGRRSEVAVCCGLTLSSSGGDVRPPLHRQVDGVIFLLRSGPSGREFAYMLPGVRRAFPPGRGAGLERSL